MNNVERPTILIATPHARYNALEAVLRRRLDCTIVRARQREELTAARLNEWKPRYVFLPQWSWKIPSEVHEAFECVIFHMTDVPFGRGGSPLQNLIARGFEETKLTALRCADEMDAGPVYLKRDLSLLGTAEEILLRASEIMADMITQIVKDRPAPVPQDGEPTLFKRRTPGDGDLTTARSLRQAYDLIRMLDGEAYPPAFLDMGPFRLELSRASLRPDAVMADVRIRLKGDGE